MKTRSHTFTSLTLRHTVLLLTGVSTLALLTACSSSSMHNPFGTGRKEQVVLPTARRVPLLNQGQPAQVAVDAQAPVAMPPAPAPAAIVPPAANSNAVSAEQMAKDPYDYYGAASAAATANPPAPQAAATDQPQGNFFSRLFSGPNASAKTETKEEKVVRKPLPSNPYGAKNTMPAGAVSQNAITELAHADMAAPPPVTVPVTGNAQADNRAAQQPVAPSPVMDKSQSDVISLPIAEAAEQPVSESAPAPAQEQPQARPSFFSRLFSPPSKPVEKQPDDAAATQDNAQAPSQENTPNWADRWLGKHEAPSTDADRNVPEPSLSSVPQTPAEFKDVKAGAQQNTQELQDEQAIAQQQKRALNSEPSQQQAAAPVDMPSGNANDAATLTQPSSRSPQRGIDIMTQEQWDALQKTRQDGSSQPVPNDAQNPSLDSGAPRLNQELPPPQSRNEEPSSHWWDGWGRSRELNAQQLDAQKANSGEGDSGAPVADDDKAGSKGDTLAAQVETQAKPSESATATAEQSHEPSARGSRFAPMFGTQAQQLDKAQQPSDRATAAAEASPAKPDEATSEDTKEAKTESAKPDAAADTAPSTEAVAKPSGIRNWFQALVKEPEVQPADNTVEVPAAEAKASGAVMAPSPEAAAAVEPVQTAGPSKAELIGEMKQPLPAMESKDQSKPEPSSVEAVAVPEPQTPAPEAPTLQASKALEPAAEPAAEATPDRASFLSRLFSTPDAQPDVVTNAAPEPSQPQPVANAAPVQDAPVTALPAAQPSSGTQLPPVTSAAAPVVAVASTSATSANIANANGALPSPQILQEIKMMPASRYAARAQATKPSSTEY